MQSLDLNVNLYSIWNSGEQFTYHGPGDTSTEPLNERWDPFTFSNLKVSKGFSFAGNRVEFSVDVRNVFNQNYLNLLCSEVSLPGSSLATTEITNDFHGVTERHAYRRIFEETTNFAFYVDAGDYTPIRFFEQWIEYATNGPLSKNARKDLLSPNYFYRMRYPAVSYTHLTLPTSDLV